MTQTSYTRELADAICGRMAEGESLRSICRDPGMPTEATVRGWSVRDHDGFDARYRQARMLMLESWADEIVDIADEADRDPRDRQIRCDVRKWLMSKLAPRRYGDKVTVGGDPESPLRVLHDQVSLEELSLAQLDALEAFTTAMIEARSGGGDALSGD